VVCLGDNIFSTQVENPVVTDSAMVFVKEWTTRKLWRGRLRGDGK
jgi:hypothetical protein